MYELESYLNIIGDFTCETEKGKSSIIGILIRKNEDENCIIFHGRIPIADQAIFDSPALDLHGVIGKAKVSLLNCYVQASTHTSEADFLNAVFALDKIVIGDHYKGEKTIQSISSEFQALSYFSMNFVGSPIHGEIEENPANANPPLTAETQFGSVSVENLIFTECTLQQMTVKSTPIVRYSFKAPKTLNGAVAHIASVRNMFSFFAGGYIDFDILEYHVNSDPNPSLSNGVTVFLNHRETLQEVSAPFLLTRRTIEGNFEKLVQNWLDFYQNSIYIPSLFFEIITNRSKGINAFLNLAQAVEVYSYYFRDAEARVVQSQDPKARKKKDPLLKHRLIDIFTYLQNVLDITDAEKALIVDVICDKRNFYTHYSKDRDEPNWRTVSRMTVFLHFVLLALVYKHIGVDDQAIQSCKHAGIFTTMDETIKIILANESASEIVLES